MPLTTIDEFESLPEATRPGTKVEGASFSAQTDTEQLKIWVEMELADRIDETLTVDFRIERSKDDGRTWTQWGGARFLGGYHDVNFVKTPNGNPGVTYYGAHQVKGMQFRATISSSRAVKARVMLRTAKETAAIGPG